MTESGMLGGREELRTDVNSYTIGPISPRYQGPVRLDFQLKGDTIEDVRIEAGYAHRGLERSYATRTWMGAIVPTDRVDSECSISYELAFCMAVEQLCHIQVPRRAQMIRLVLCELSRVEHHLGYLVRIARAAGSDTTAHYVSRERELILDLFELMTGSRFNHHFLRYGGVAQDITEGFIERIFDAARLIHVRLREYDALMIDNRAFIDRLAWIGAVKPEDVIRYGVSGPNARAAGVHYDIRKITPYSGYELLNFSVPIGRGEGGAIGDSFDRLRVRLEEIRESLMLLTQLVENIPLGDYQSLKVAADFSVPQGETCVSVESARGHVACHVVSDGSTAPVRVQWRTPSQNAIEALPLFLRGEHILDADIIAASLDFTMAEVDR